MAANRTPKVLDEAQYMEFDNEYDIMGGAVARGGGGGRAGGRGAAPVIVPTDAARKAEAYVSVVELAFTDYEHAGAQVHTDSSRSFATLFFGKAQIVEVRDVMYDQMTGVPLAKFSFKVVKPLMDPEFLALGYKCVSIGALSSKFNKAIIKACKAFTDGPHTKTFPVFARTKANVEAYRAVILRLDAIIALIGHYLPFFVAGDDTIATPFDDFEGTDEAIEAEFGEYEDAAEFYEDEAMDEDVAPPQPTGPIDLTKDDIAAKDDFADVTEYIRQNAKNMTPAQHIEIAQAFFGDDVEKFSALMAKLTI